MSVGVTLDKPYTVDEMAALLQLNRKTVIRLITAGKLGAFRVGREYRISKEDYQDYMRRERVSPKRDGTEKSP